MPIKNLNSIKIGESQNIGISELAWNSDEQTFDMGLANGVVLQAGHEMFFYGKAIEAISDGDAVQFAGSQGSHLLIKKAVPSEINLNPEYFIGVSTQSFALNDFGYITVFGKVRGLDTTIYRNGDPSAEGKVLYFNSGGVIAGELTVSEPVAPNAKIRVAAVTYDNPSQGTILVRPATYPKLDALSNVDTSISKTTPIDADTMLLNDSASANIWKKISWANIKTTLKTYFDTLYQKGTGTTNYIPKFTGNTTLNNSIIYDDGTNVGIGNATPSSKLDVSGDINLSGIVKGTAYTTSTALSTNVDFTAAQVFTKTLIGTTILTFSNYSIGQVKDLIITGNFTLTLPGSVKITNGNYDGTVNNLIQVLCVDSTTPVFWVSISQPQTSNVLP